MEGNAKIGQAVCDSNVDTNDVSIEWKPGRIIVTVASDAVYLSSNEITSPEDEELMILEDDDDAADELEQLADDDTTTATVAEGAVDLTQLARAINAALEDTMIAETHEIEVTTPGATEELQGEIMWKAYRGFDVIAVYENPKTNKVQTLEGRLVERNDDHTILNMKGRMRKLLNDKLQSVKLPKAKREKGS